MSKSQNSTPSKNLRIDYSKYNIDEVVGTIADAIVFPFYIGKVALKVVLGGIFAIFILGFLSTNHWVLTLLFSLLTVIISSPSLVLISFIVLINTIVSDIHKVIQITIETTKHVYEDSGLLKEQRTSGLPLKSSFTDVFRGVSLYIVRPSLQRVLSKKLGKFAFPITFMIDKLFKYIIIKKQPQFEVEMIEDKTGDHIEVSQKSLDNKLIKGSEKATSISGNVIKFPFYLALFIYGSINFILIWILLYIF